MIQILKSALIPSYTVAGLPQVRGRMSMGRSLARMTWFGVGGPADAVFKPADEDDLISFLRQKSADIRYMMMGVGSNCLIRDGGVTGVVIRLGLPFAKVRVMDDGHVVAGAGVLDAQVADTSAMAGRCGLEFLSGIPGTVGGAVRMNAGAYGSEISDVLIEAVVLDPMGARMRLRASDLGFGYRKCSLPEDWIILEATFRTGPGSEEDSRARIRDIQAARSATQPVRGRTGGSTFTNPDGYKAWQLIDQAGCRGWVRGDACVSEKHCNFLINRGHASAADLEGLGEDVQHQVYKKTGINLIWEIKRIGHHRPSSCLAHHLQDGRQT